MDKLKLYKVFAEVEIYAVNENNAKGAVHQALFECDPSSVGIEGCEELKKELGLC